MFNKTYMLVLFIVVLCLTVFAAYNMKPEKMEFSESLLNTESKVIGELVDHIKNLGSKIKNLEHELGMEKEKNNHHHKMNLRSLGIYNDARNLDSAVLANEIAQQASNFNVTASGGAGGVGGAATSSSA